jgi:hypothetical protein
MPGKPVGTSAQMKQEESSMPRAVLTQLMLEGTAEEAMNLYVSLF